VGGSCTLREEEEEEGWWGLLGSGVYVVKPPKKITQKNAAKQISKSLGAIISADERLLVRLKEFSRSPDERTRQQTQSLVMSYLRHHDWTGPQRRLVKLICGVPLV